MKKYAFTLLEVIIALLIISIGVFFLLGQFSLARDRVSNGSDQWEQTHELINAAEFLLLNGKGEEKNPFLNTEKYKIRYSLRKAELPSGMEHPLNGMTLKTLKVMLYLQTKPDMEIDSVSVDCFREAADADVTPE